MSAERDDVVREAEAPAQSDADSETRGGGAAGATGLHEGASATAGLDTESEILRTELAGMSQKLSAAQAEVTALNERYLRTRAEFDTFRRRMVDELSLAREAGLDSAVLPVLTVFDDLGRAIEAAERGADATGIVPGVKTVLENLLRALDGLGVKAIGAVGEVFDPHYHEAVAAVPPTNREQAGTIMQVHRTGFAKGERVIRAAAVTVYQE